jgi:cytolysin (calcineurin-like family phosphatase)
MGSGFNVGSSSIHYPIYKGVHNSEELRGSHGKLQHLSEHGIATNNNRVSQHCSDGYRRNTQRSLIKSQKRHQQK